VALDGLSSRLRTKLRCDHIFNAHQASAVPLRPMKESREFTTTPTCKAMGLDYLGKFFPVEEKGIGRGQ
jgi:hypothetical protein